MLGELEKEQFVRLMRMYETLFGLPVVTYCVMGNHFHVLVEVPKCPEVTPTDAELVALIRRAKGGWEADSLEWWFEMWREQGNLAAKSGGTLAWYRMQLLGRGEERRDASGKVTKEGLTQAVLAATESRQGKMPWQDYLWLRVRYFTDGAVLGTKAFVNEIFKAKRE